MVRSAGMTMAGGRETASRPRAWAAGVRAPEVRASARDAAVAAGPRIDLSRWLDTAAGSGPGEPDSQAPQATVGSLRVSRRSDPEEVQADQIADRILQGTAGGARADGATGPCAHGCGSGEPGVMRSAAPGSDRPSGGDRRPDAGPRRDPQALVTSLGPGRPLDRADRDFFEPRLGRDLGDVLLHTGADAHRGASAVHATAFTVGSDVALGRRASVARPGSGRRLLAHELAHVVQQDRGPLAVQRVGPEDPPFGYFPAERKLQEAAGAEEQAKERRHEAWQASHKAGYPAYLAGPGTTPPEDIAAGRRQLVEQRVAMLTAAARTAAGQGGGWSGGAGWPGGGAYRLPAGSGAGPDPFAPMVFPSVPAGLAPAYAGVVQEQVVLKAMLAAGQLDDEIAAPARSRFVGFYHALVPFARDVDRSEVQRAEQSRWFADVARQQATPCPNCHTPTRAVPPVYQALPPRAPEFTASLQTVLLAATDAQWRGAMAAFDRDTLVMDGLVLSVLPSDAPAGQAFTASRDLLARQEQLQQTYPDAVRIRTVFYPKDRWVTVDQEDGTKVEIADGIPWYFYLSHTASPNPTVYPDGFSWTLRDVTAPNRPQVSYEPNAFERVLRTSRGRTVDQPPIELFGKLNDALVFPKGVVYWKMPDGSTWSLETTEPRSLSDWLTAIGLGLAGLGLILATGGLASPGVLAALGIASAGFSIASTVADLGHRSELGILTTEDRNRAILFIATDIASALSLGLGHAAAELTRAGVAAGRITRLTIIIRRAATAAAIADKALGGAVLVTISADFILQYQAIMSSNLSGPEREQALRELAGQALLTGAIVVAPHAVEAVAARVRKRAGAGEPLGGAGRDPLGLTAGGAGEPVATVTQLEREPGHGWAGGRSDAEGRFVDWSAKQETLPPERAAHELQIAQSEGREHPMDKETGYVRDLELEGHHWQEKADSSGWCRLSTRKCYSSTQLKVGSKGSAERTTAVTVQDVAARRAELAHPPSPRPQGTTGRDWADYVFYANRRLNAIEEALRAGQKPKTPPRTFQSFVTEHPLGSPVRNEIQGTRFEQRTRAEAEKALGQERAQLLLSQANLSEVLNPTVAEGELTRPDLLIPDMGGTRTAVSNKSRVSMESMTPAAAEKQVVFDLTEARLKYTGEKYVRRTGEKADITRVWLLYDAAGVPEKLRPVVRKAVADYQRLHPELRFEVGIF